MCLQQRMKLSKGVVLSITVIICHVIVHAAGVRVVVVAMRRNETLHHTGVHAAAELLQNACTNARQVRTHNAPAAHVGPADARNLREPAEVNQADTAFDRESHVRQHDRGGGDVEGVSLQMTRRNLTHLIPTSARVEVGWLPGGGGRISICPCSIS
jgi:hypothetical protein